MGQLQTSANGQNALRARFVPGSDSARSPVTHGEVKHRRSHKAHAVPSLPIQGLSLIHISEPTRPY